MTNAIPAIIASNVTGPLQEVSITEAIIIVFMAVWVTLILTLVVATVMERKKCKH